ncbi:unnamed protein product [Echinostoma caproni]|uniref:Integrase_H2C2 domain-containing protein n=1 Tax=Echinostoma caproni TaxID=27848 RepID=A0A183ALQ5_9TREM|nr:unnamed protein product [Echinostoma caproni]
MLAAVQDPHDMVRERRKNQELRKVIETISEGQQYRNIQHVKSWRSVWKQLKLNAAGILMKRQPGRRCFVVVIPNPLRQILIKEGQELAHTGCAQTYDLLRQRVYWPNMQTEVSNQVLAGEKC